MLSTAESRRLPRQHPNRSMCDFAKLEKFFRSRQAVRTRDMSWRGTIRAIEAAERRAQRGEQRRFKELQRRNKELTKLSALEQARLEVETYDNRLEVLLSIHKEQGNEWDWHGIAQSFAPMEPARGNRHQADAAARHALYEPGFFDRLFGK